MNIAKYIMAPLLTIYLGCSPTVFGLIAANKSSSPSNHTTHTQSNFTDCIDVIVNDDQTLSDIKPTITSNDLLGLGVTLLQSNDGSESTMQQNIEFPSDPPQPNNRPTGSFVRFNQRDYLYFREDVTMLNFSLNFNPPLKSLIDQNGNLESLTDQRLNILGNQYLVCKAKVTRLQLEIGLVYGRPTITRQGEVTKKTIQDTEYRIVPTIVDHRSRSTQFRVNGFETGIMEAGDVITLPDQTKFAHAGFFGSFVRYQLDPHIITLYDNDFSDNLFTSNGLSLNQNISLDSNTSANANLSNAILILDSYTLQIQPTSRVLIPVQSSLQDSYNFLSVIEDSINIYYVGRHANSNTLRICVGR